MSLTPHPLTTDMLLADVIAGDAEAIHRLIALNPVFAVLLDPEHRNAMVGQIRLGEAARVAEVPFDALCAVLQGKPAVSAAPKQPAVRKRPFPGDWFEQAESLSAPHLDVRPLLASGQDPFAEVMSASAKVPPGGFLVVDAPFDPAPLRRVLAGKGFTSLGRQMGPGHWRICWRREEPAAVSERRSETPMPRPRPGAMERRRRRPSGRARPATARTDDPRARPDRRGRLRQSGAASRPRTRPPLSHAGRARLVVPVGRASGRRSPHQAGAGTVMITPGGGRLLPASIPFRFLAAALVFHLAGWTALAAGAPLLATDRRRARPAARGPSPDDAGRADRHGHGRRVPIAAGGDPGRSARRLAVPPRQLAAAAGRCGAGLGHDDGAI